MHTATTPTPQLFFETLQAQNRTAALKAAIDLALFTAIGEGAQTVPAIAKRTGASERGVRILCDFLCVAGFLSKDRDRYALTPDTAFFLDTRSPAYIGSAADFMASPQLASRVQQLTDIVRRGKPDQTEMVPDNPAWIHFARVMAPLMSMPAQMLAELLDVGKAASMRVLDVAAGHGLFGIEVAKRNAKAQVTGLDWKTVLPVARENAAAAGVADRYHTIEGDALSGDLGGPYDLVLIPNFLHHFDVETNTAFLRRVRGALAPGGRVAVFEFVPDENRISPPPPAAFSLIMLMMTEAGDAYPFSVYQRMFRDAGYSKVSQHPMPPGFETAIVAA